MNKLQPKSKRAKPEGEKVPMDFNTYTTTFFTPISTGLDKKIGDSNFREVFSSKRKVFYLANIFEL